MDKYLGRKRVDRGVVQNNVSDSILFLDIDELALSRGRVAGLQLS